MKKLLIIVLSLSALHVFASDDSGRAGARIFKLALDNAGTPTYGSKDVQGQILKILQQIAVTQNKMAGTLDKLANQKQQLIDLHGQMQFEQRTLFRELLSAIKPKAAPGSPPSSPELSVSPSDAPSLLLDTSSASSSPSCDGKTNYHD